MREPTHQTINEITTLVAAEKQQAYEEGVRAATLSVDRIVAWLTIEPFDIDEFRRWAKLEQERLLRAHPFLGPVEPPVARRIKVFEVEYNHFEPGTLVTPTSLRSVLVEGQVYTITKCLPPRFADDRASCFVEGRETGLSTEYLKEVEPGESP